MSDVGTSHAATSLIADDLRSVVARLVRRMRASYAIPPHQFGALRSIEVSGPLTASQLAALELVRPQSMAHTIAQLEGADLVTRHPDPSDGRQTLIALSDTGVLALAAQRREITGWLAEAIEENLDADERDTLAGAVTLLSRLVEG